MKMLIATQIKI